MYSVCGSQPLSHLVTCTFNLVFLEDKNELKPCLNFLKTNYMVFSSKTVCKNINIVSDEQLIERVHTTKFLGVITDDKLSWHHHVAYVCKKLNKSLSVIYLVKNILHVNSLKHLYNVLILPYLFYCCEVWGNASKYLIERVVALQKRAIGVISKIEYRALVLVLFIDIEIFIDPC